MSDVDVAVLRRHGRVVERQARPQQAADHAHFAGALELEAPRRCERQRLMLSEGRGRGIAPALRSPLSPLQEHYNIQMPERRGKKRKKSALFDLTSAVEPLCHRGTGKKPRAVIFSFFPFVFDEFSITSFWGKKFGRKRKAVTRGLEC